MKLKFLEGFWGLLGKISINLTKLIPLYILVFIAWGDLFLPSPLSDFSKKTRTTINKTLTGAFISDSLENEKYNNKRTDKIIEETEKNYGRGKKDSDN